MSRFYLNKLRLALMAAILANRTATAELTLLAKINGVRKCTLKHDSLTVLLKYPDPGSGLQKEEPWYKDALGSRKAPHCQQAQQEIPGT